jgi:hypothetical protein
VDKLADYINKSDFIKVAIGENPGYKSGVVYGLCQDGVTECASLEWLGIGEEEAE